MPSREASFMFIEIGMALTNLFWLAQVSLESSLRSLQCWKHTIVDDAKSENARRLGSYLQIDIRYPRHRWKSLGTTRLWSVQLRQLDSTYSRRDGNRIFASKSHIYARHNQSIISSLDNPTSAALWANPLSINHSLIRDPSTSKSSITSSSRKMKNRACWYQVVLNYTTVTMSFILRPPPSVASPSTVSGKVGQDEQILSLSICHNPIPTSALLCLRPRTSLIATVEPRRGQRGWNPTSHQYFRRRRRSASLGPFIPGLSSGHHRRFQRPRQSCCARLGRRDPTLATLRNLRFVSQPVKSLCRHVESARASCGHLYYGNLLSARTDLYQLWQVCKGGLLVMATVSMLRHSESDTKMIWSERLRGGGSLAELS